MREPGDGDGSFTRFLKSLDIDIPCTRRVQKLVEWGWLTPRLRVRIPEEFLTAWENYPLADHQGSIPEEHSWAWVGFGSVEDRIPHRLHPGAPLPDRWYVHPLDDQTDADIRGVWSRRVAPEDLRTEVPLFSHPRGIKTHPFVDWFAYWQAYYIRELEHDLCLFEKVENRPGAKEDLVRVVENFDRYKSISQARSDTTAKRWKRLEPIFEWLTRYRTLLGKWAFHGLAEDDRRAAEAAFVTDLGLTEDRVRSDIRDGLLTMWNEWKLFDGRYFSDKMWDLLREDIHHAFGVLAAVTGKRADLRDPYFDPADLSPRAWARPREVLPFEFLRAREDFPVFGPIYLTAANALLSPAHRLDGPKLSVRLPVWWGNVPAFQRFCMNLHRLHRHYNAARTEARVMLEEATPIDFLLLTAQSAERILLHLFLKALPSANAPPVRQAGEMERRPDHDSSWNCVDRCCLSSSASKHSPP